MAGKVTRSFRKRSVHIQLAYFLKPLCRLLRLSDNVSDNEFSIIFTTVLNKYYHLSIIPVTITFYIDLASSEFTPWFFL